MVRIEQRTSGARMSNVQRYWRGKDWPARPAAIEGRAWQLWREHVGGTTFTDLARRECVSVSRMRDTIWRVEAAIYGEQHPEQFPARALADAGPGAAGARDQTATGARHPHCTSMQCGIVGACCYSVCIGPLVEALGEDEGERAWAAALRAGGAGETDKEGWGDGAGRG